MKTVLLVSADEQLRSRLAHALAGRSVFFAASDDEALKTLRVTPAMAAGLTDHVWELEEIVELLENQEAASLAAN